MSSVLDLRTPNGFFEPVRHRRLVTDFRVLSQLTTTSGHRIDCDANPSVPEGLAVEEHMKGGSLIWDASKIELAITDGQRRSGVIGGNELRRELAGKPRMNANVLDYLLSHPYLIPEKWKRSEDGQTLYVFFWGTIYRAPDGCLFVRCIYWSHNQWKWSTRSLGNRWLLGDPAALAR